MVLFTLVMCTLYPRGVLLGILGGGVPPGDPNLTLFQTKTRYFLLPFSDLAPFVQKVDSAIRWINYYPKDNAVGFRTT